MAKDNRLKRWLREHRPKKANVRVVNSPRNPAEGRARVSRAEALVGTPFVRLPGVVDHSAILFTATDGTPIPAEAVEMVFNDALLMDAVGNWGELAPLYSATIKGRQREVYDFALNAYVGVEIPPQLRRPANI